MTKKERLPALVELVMLVREIVRILKSETHTDQLAYTVPQLAARVGVSDQQIYNHIENRDLTPKYSGTKTLIPVEEARRFIAELPEQNMGSLR